MAEERSRREEWEPENQLRAREARDADDEWQVGPTAHEPYERIELPNSSVIGEPAVDWSDQPTQPQRRVEVHRDWPAQPSGPHPEWPLRSESGASGSPLHRLLDAAHERQFNLGCGAVAALVLIVAAILAAFTNGWLPGNASPVEPQPSIQANPAQSTAPIPTITPRPTPTATPVPTDTPIPTDTPVPTDTPLPTESPIPTQTSIPLPSPTAAPLPTETPAPTEEP
ncbi:MAG TPA: hypothetical protein VF510_26500 [Ktedonobacterales bacterium]